MVVSRHGRRVEIGPKSILLEYEESLLPLHLSKGPNKDGHHTTTTCFLQIRGARVADTFDIESSDFVKLRLKLGFTGHFEGSPESWFQVDDPVKLLAHAVRARLRRAARSQSFAQLVRSAGALVQSTLFSADGTGELRFEENGMVIDSCELLKLDIVDPALSSLFADAQREAVKLQITDETATRRLESERHQDHVDAEEHAIVRGAVTRKAESRLVDAETEHRVDLRKIELQHEQAARQLDEELGFAERRAAMSAERQRILNAIEEAHLAKVVEIERARALAEAEAEAMRLAAIQPELVGALHAAADAEVMKTAAANMNLVSLLGGKTPQELLEHVLKGTPLERSSRDMRARSTNGTHGTHGTGPAGEAE
jgi:hypothetical protein